jgi:DNA topoisomerase IB
MRKLLRRRRPDETLLAYYENRTWTNVSSADINEYLQALFGDDISSKDFRTWHGTVLAAVALALAEQVNSPTARKKARARAMREVSHYLGNTPAVCRSSYVDPSVVDAFDRGETVRAVLDELGAETAEQFTAHTRVERAVLDLLERCG